MMCYDGRMTIAAGIYTDDVPRKPEPKPERKTVEEAAAEIGVSPGTVWRYLEKGWLKRYYSRVGRLKTVVDMRELRELRENPPSEPAN